MSYCFPWAEWFCWKACRPALAGILIAVPWFGVNGVYFLRVIAFGWVMFSILQIPILGEPEPREASATGALRDIGEGLTSGLRYIWKHETLLSLFIFAVVTMLLGQSYQQLLPAYALETSSSEHRKSEHRNDKTLTLTCLSISGGSSP